MSDYWIYIAIAGCIVQTAFTCFEYAKKPVAAVIFKGVASLFFVLLGFVGLTVTGDARFAVLVIAGLVFGAVGDVLLNLYKLVGKAEQQVFMGGMAAFFIGHLVYIVALLSHGINALFVAVPVCAVLSAALLPWMLGRINAEGKIRIFGIVYMALIFLMLGCSAGLMVLQPFNIGHLLFVIGAVFFALSDVILVFDLFGNHKYKSFRACNLAAYYLAQVLIALSIIFV